MVVHGENGGFLHSAVHRLGQWIQPAFLGKGVWGSFMFLGVLCCCAGVFSAILKNTMDSTVHILLVDDHPILRDSVREFLSRHAPRFEVVGEAGNSEEAWQAVVRLEPDLVVMDLEFPGEGGIELTRKIHKAFPKTAVLILTAHTGGQRINDALDAGASGYVLKSCSSQDLISAIEATMSGQIYLSPAASTVVVREYQRQLKGSDDKILSAREIETLKRIAAGQTTKEIAFAMKVSTKTIETHRLNLMAKLEISTVAGLTKYAVREGLTTL